MALKTLALLLILGSFPPFPSSSPSLVSISQACPPSCKYCDSDGVTCEGCYAGYIFSSEIPVGCEPCPEGYTSEGSSYTCTQCPGGTYSVEDRSSCEYCPDGYFSTEGSNSCSLCPEGSVPDEGQDACVACDSGYWANPGDSECMSCGEYCEECGSSTTCKECEDFTENINGRCLLACSQTEGIDVSFGDCVDGECGRGCQECAYDGYDCFSCYSNDRHHSAQYLVCSLPESPVEKESPAEVSLKSATASSNSGLGVTSVVAKALSAASSIAFRFGVVAEVVRNARYFGIGYSERTVKVFTEEDSDPFQINAPGSFESQVGPKKLHGNFVKYSVEPNFLINYWNNLVSILVLSACLVIFKVSEIYLEKNKKVWARGMLRILKVSATNFLINNLYGSFDQILLFFIFEVQTCSFGSIFSWSSFICAAVFLTIGLGFFGFHFYVLKKYQAAKSHSNDQEKNDNTTLEAFKSRHAHVKVLYKDFKDDSLVQQSFLAPLMIRSCILNVFLCLLVDHPLVEACLYLAVNLSFAIFLVIKRPFEEFKNAAAQYFCEIIILITYSGVLALAIMDHNGGGTASSRENLEKVIVILGIVLNIGGIVFQCIEILGAVYEAYKSFKAWRSSSKVAAMAKNAAADLLSQKESARELNLVDFYSTPSNQNLTSLASSPIRTQNKLERLTLPSTSQSLNSLSTDRGGSQSDLDKPEMRMEEEKKDVRGVSSRILDAEEMNVVSERVVVKIKGPFRGE